ncbi:hypothetical protein HDG34_001148 [Paraburkholderia sp. HC6.4b]|nr:hypothetical protein [Paraburkholderia sp. HC6.4b]MBB5449622.1 hypothetical protein [Paraburkholderia sp. Kb1A]
MGGVFDFVRPASRCIQNDSSLRRYPSRIAMPPGALAQSTGGAATVPGTSSSEVPLVSGPSDAHADPILPPDIARGVFGTYGGAQSRFSDGGGSGGTGGKTGSKDWRAPIVAQQLPDLGSGDAGSLSPQAERKLGERVMREIRRDPDYLDD